MDAIACKRHSNARNIDENGCIPMYDSYHEQKKPSPFCFDIWSYSPLATLELLTAPWITTGVTT